HGPQPVPGPWPRWRPPWRTPTGARRDSERTRAMAARLDPGRRRRPRRCGPGRRPRKSRHSSVSLTTNELSNVPLALAVLLVSSMRRVVLLENWVSADVHPVVLPGRNVACLAVGLVVGRHITRGLIRLEQRPAPAVAPQVVAGE